MADDELVLNFGTPANSTAPAAPPRAAKGGRWTDRAKERKRSQIEHRRATKQQQKPSTNKPSQRDDAAAEGEAGAPGSQSSKTKATHSSNSGAGGGGGRGRLERAVGPAGQKQYISSLFTAEGLPVPSTSSSTGGKSADVLPAKPSNAPLTATTNADEAADQDHHAEAAEEEKEEEGPDPAPELTKLGLSREIVAALAGKLGITGPTACQAGAIPRLLHQKLPTKNKGKGKGKGKGQDSSSFAHDAILRAQTGSGKTLTFLLPMLEDLLHLPLSTLNSAATSSASGPGSIDRSIGTLALILAPTRELATQIHTVLSSLLSALPSSSRFTVSPRTLTAGLLVGGANRTHEKRRLRKGCPIVVATPGRVLDHLKTTEAFRLAGEPVRAAGPSGRGGGSSGRGANAAPLGPPRGRAGASAANNSSSSNRLGLRWLIVDECDRLMDLGFEEQMRGILEEIQRRSSTSSSPASFSHGPSPSSSSSSSSQPPSSATRRTILCSATASEGVDRLAGLAIGQTHEGDDDDGEAAAMTMPVIGARDDVQIAEPVRKDLTTVAATSQKRAARDEDDEADKENGEEKEADDDNTATNEAAATTSLSVPSGFTPPSQLLHHYVIVPPKLRFVALVALLRKLLVKQQRGGGPTGKILVFMSCTDAVDFWWKALGKIKMGGGRNGDDEGEENEWEKEDKDADADRLVSLHPLLSGIPIYRLHGSLPLKTRLASLNAFSKPYTIEEGHKKAGQETDAGVLLCTSVAARGLDVKNVACVVQVDAPTEVRTRFSSLSLFLSTIADQANKTESFPSCAQGGVTEYVHRVGRTARAGAQGTAYSFVLPNESEYPSYLEEGINAKEASSSGKREEKVVKLREVGVEQVLREGYGGEGREYETRATDVQMGFERWVNGSEEVRFLVLVSASYSMRQHKHLGLILLPLALQSASLARKAFQAHIRAYATHPAAEKHLFNLKAVHLGHLAKSFGMREAPGHHLASSNGGPARKKARTGNSSAGGFDDGSGSGSGGGFEVGRRRKTLDAEARMRKLMRGPQANGGGEFQIAGAGELEGLVSRGGSKR